MANSPRARLELLLVVFKAEGGRITVARIILNGKAEGEKGRKISPYCDQATQTSTFLFP
jgi:hypothetical protein